MKLFVPLILLAASALPAQTTPTTTYTLPPAVCVHITNCIIYGPAESFSLWTTTSWSIFSIYSWVNGFSIVDTFNCTSETYSSTPSTGTGVVIAASCSGKDANGAAFSMTYTVDAYSYYSRGGGGKGGGGAGTRWQITGGSVVLTR